MLFSPSVIRFGILCNKHIATTACKVSTIIFWKLFFYINPLGISDDVKIRPREHVREDAGHRSSAITDKYIDVELRERHNGAKRKRIKPEFMEINT